MSQDFILNKLTHDSDKSIMKSRKTLAKHVDFKQTECFICKSKRASNDCKIFGINYLICKNCSHTYVDKRFSEKVLSKYYFEDDSYSSNTYADKKLMKIRDDVIEPKIQFIKKYAKGKKWLDVGSAEGSAITACQKLGFDATGIELSENSRKFAKKYRKIDLYPNTLEQFHKESDVKWDVISFFGVLEHLPDPISTLKISNSMLKKDGIIAIDVPNYNSVSSYVQKLTKNPSRHLIPHSHIMLFTIKSLEFALKKSRFNPISMWLWGMDVIELLKYISGLDKNFLDSQLGQFLISKANEIQSIFDKEKLGDDFVMIARKI